MQIMCKWSKLVIILVASCIVSVVLEWSTFNATCHDSEYGIFFFLNVGWRGCTVPADQLEMCNEVQILKTVYIT